MYCISFFGFSLFVNDSSQIYGSYLVYLEVLILLRIPEAGNIEFLTIILLDDKLENKKHLHLGELIVNKYIILQKADLKT